MNSLTLTFCTNKILLVIFVSTLFCYSQAFAADINQTSRGVAIGGYDTTAYFTQGQAIKGDERYQYEWQGVTWYFASKQARDLFAGTPQKYVPQFGGYCSNGLADDHKIAANPTIWRIIDGKLYLYFSNYGRTQWSGKVKSLIEAASQTWGDLKSD